tara:strand:+ start:1220 stop:1342 length:123 start_codon:yes stop_codon:yes gene_type:complete
MLLLLGVFAALILIMVPLFEQEAFRLIEKYRHILRCSEVL